MTPGARISAAIELLDRVISGEVAEKILTNWGRANRYAGSKDRVAIRDHVFDALRCLSSFAALGGSNTGRGIMIGALRAQGIDPSEMFTGQGYAPPILSEDELRMNGPSDDEATRLDSPQWLVADLRESLGENFVDVMQKLQTRAPVFLRVNNVLGDAPHAISLLREEEIEVQTHPLSPTALEVTKNPRRIRNSRAYKEGYVELQDAASQAVVDKIPLGENTRVLDFCAGGGGKSLALAGRGAENKTQSNAVQLFAYDNNPARLRDLPARAERAGALVEILELDAVKSAEKFDVVLADVPCTGSGAWRRNPDAKWRLTPEKLQEFTKTQAEILNEVKQYVAPGGRIAYVTCSLLNAENEDQISAFLSANPTWRLEDTLTLTPLAGGDGFYLSLLCDS